MVKILYVLCVCHFIVFSPRLSAQQFSAASFDQLPANQQLYGRNPDNQADITFAGKVTAGGYAYLSVLKYRNGAKTGYLKAALNYSNTATANFSLSTKIKAELAEYAFEVYACKSQQDSTLIVKRTDVVAGDFYIIYGQSNAVAWEVDYPYRNEYCRTYGSLGTWALSNNQTPRVGIFGIEFQRKIAEDHQIPTCVINGAVAGAPISALLSFNADHNAQDNSPYGLLYGYARSTGLIPFIKGILYWQGEAEASSNDPAAWGPQFDQLMVQWKRDYPATEKIYVFQLPLFGGGAYDDKIGVIREQQRTLNQKYPQVEPYGALGAVGWNGFHYGLEGYLQLGRELATIAGYNHYGNKKKISSPNLKKAFYSTPERDEVTMVFEDYQQMVYPKDTIYDNIQGSQEARSLYSVKDFFYLNYAWQKVKSGRAESNRIILKLKEAGKDSLIKYLPSKYHYSGLPNAPWVYLGPFLRNSDGLRALAFHHNPIFPYEKRETLSLAASETRQNVLLKWNKLTNITGYILERFQDIDSLGNRELFYLPDSQTEYVDKTARQGIHYTYQIRGYSTRSESPIAYLSYTKVSEDSFDKNTITIFPNPTSGNVNISSIQSEINKVEIFSVQGIHLTTLAVAGQNLATINLAGFSSGNYVIQIHCVNGDHVSKKLAIK